MSTPYTCGHFQMPPLFIRQLWSRTDKGAAKEEGKRCWGIIFYVVAGKPNRIKSARPSMFHVTLQKRMWVWSERLWRAEGDDLLLYWFTYGKWMNGNSWFDIFAVENLFTWTVCRSRTARTIPHCHITDGRCYPHIRYWVLVCVGKKASALQICWHSIFS